MSKYITIDNLIDKLHEGYWNPDEKNDHPVAVAVQAIQMFDGEEFNSELQIKDHFRKVASHWFSLYEKYKNEMKWEQSDHYYTWWQTIDEAEEKTLHVYFAQVGE